MRIEELAKSLDLTVLRTGATVAEVEAACHEALALHVAAVCAHPTFVPAMAGILAGTDVKVCTVVSFPHGADLPEVKAHAAARAVAHGAEEIDVQMNLSALLSGEFALVRDELLGVARAARASRDVIVKVIIEAPLLDDKLIRLACKIVADAGADFAKTASGVGTAARVRDVELMRECLPAAVAVKAAGGIRTPEQAEELIEAGAVRLGASAAADILRRVGTPT
jgi:deoxyribose-phosphate aldolase